MPLITRAATTVTAHPLFVISYGGEKSAHQSAKQN